MPEEARWFEEVESIKEMTFAGVCHICDEVVRAKLFHPCPICGGSMKKVNTEKEMIREQIERLLNQSGVAVTPEKLAETKFFTVTSSNGDEWDISLRNWKFKLKRDANGVYTCETV